MIFTSRIMRHNLATKNIVYFNESNMIKSYSLDYFIEGVSDKELFDNDIKVILKSSDDIVQSNNNIINYFTSNVNKYIHYYVKYKNYHRDFMYNSESDSFISMIRGDISGNVSLKSCGVTPESNTLVVLCYRRPDMQFIGEYPVNSDGSYNIPNLDTNTKYDIILFDKSMKIEKLVHSNRIPKQISVPQISASKPIIKNFYNESSNYIFDFDITREVYKDYDYMRLVYVGEDGSKNEIVQDYILGKKINLFRRNLKYGYYKLEAIYNDLITPSDLFNYKDAENIEIIVPDDTYTPPNGDNINFIL